MSDTDLAPVVEPQVIVLFTKKSNLLRPSRQKIRVTYKNAGNHKTYAVSNDAYVNLEDAEAAAVDVTGRPYRPWGQVVFTYRGFSDR